MDPEIESYIIGITSDFWATMYRKRATAADKSNEFFDSAADISQYSFMTMYQQDQCVKAYFRDFVSYIEKVNLCHRQYQSIKLNSSALKRTSLCT